MSTVLAVIMAGGQGERLSILSEKRAKPAVPFAGKYRIIDFVLSNCVNSGIFEILVLTQYRPHSLQEHIGIGKPWDLDRRNGGIHLLQPYVGRQDSDWYSGTADAVYQNLSFLMESDAEYVLVLAGDQIYRMDYRPMIEFHKQHNADVTLGGIVIPIEEGYRFGILETDAEGRVKSFEEKPKEPKGTLGSMGIYVFNRETLAKLLLADAHQASSQHDFGRNIIPGMVERGEGVYAFPYNDYWQDVGTVQSYWETHMELLNDPPAFDLYDPTWVVHTKSEERPPAHIDSKAKIQQSMISHGCIIKGTVEHSVLSPGVIVEEGAVVRDSIILFDTVIGAGSVIDRVILDKEVVVGKNSRIGYGDENVPNRKEPSRLNTGISLVGKRTRLPDNLTLGRNVKVGAELAPENFPDTTIESGASVEDSSGIHRWELDLARRRAAVTT